MNTTHSFYTKAQRERRKRMDVVLNALYAVDVTPADIARRFTTSKSAVTPILAGESGRLVGIRTKAAKIRAYIIKVTGKTAEELWPGLEPIRVGRPRGRKAA